MSRQTDLLSVFGGIFGLLSLPFGFLTGKVPYLHHVSEDEDGGRNLTFKLTTPDEARELFAGQKEELGGDLERMKNEIQAIIQEAKDEQNPQA